LIDQLPQRVKALNAAFKLTHRIKVTASLSRAQEIVQQSDTGGTLLIGPEFGLDNIQSFIQQVFSHDPASAKGLWAWALLRTDPSHAERPASAPPVAGTRAAPLPSTADFDWQASPEALQDQLRRLQSGFRPQASGRPPPSIPGPLPS